ncbi:radical SAM protein [Streptomyces gilvosporeus]|uniref:Pyrroloquinoline quinone biosynthesis protein PqqE n=1 Tax=Streptomyces gilvosporeus TaxID=553510 RepID=A0A1V0TSZ6_9ACTN|nr:radical SAM protein [Streptomyces gilvosporeus]ARF56013.1 pyrroloquinoline quinone biosynthesis protein PqqE [Streptomyces gilvosporeus]
MSARNIVSDTQTASCYFRTSVTYPHRKALVQITERCNLKCAHCFVSAGDYGDTIPLAEIRDKVAPRLAAARVTRVTLTGGEPFAHPDLLDVVDTFRDAGMSVGICTNATITTDEQITALAERGVHMNVSLDGFAANSHGKFRGNRNSFFTTVETVKKFAAAGVLQGLLCTPNSLAEDAEYAQLCEFAKEQGARYVLMNPLSSMGRGVKAQRKLASPDEHMRRIYDLTARFDDDDLDMVHIRFPNTEGKPLAGCEAGNIIYVFTPGEVTVCPYLVFAARTPQSQHTDTEFIVGNIFRDADLAERLDAYKFHDRYTLGDNSTCRSCSLSGDCGKGCPAAVVAAGERIGTVDTALCPVTPSGRPLLPVATA